MTARSPTLLREKKLYFEMIALPPEGALLKYEKKNIYIFSISLFTCLYLLIFHLPCSDKYQLTSFQ